jgi:crotonobetaine/carnitine-CoA ligase
MIDIALRERTLPRTFARALERGPDRPFLVTAGATVTYAEAERLVAGLAGHGALAAGAALAVGPRFSARSFWGDVAATGATQVNAMGSMLRILALQEPHPGERAHSVRSVFVAPLPTDAAALAERFAVAFSTTYAQTEWLPSAMTAPGEGYGRAGVTGPLLDVGELRVVDGDDVGVPDGTIGEITLRAHEPGVTFPGYLGRAAESLEAFRNLRFHTGDLGEIRDGWLYFHGRVDDVIRRRGENISPTVLEELLGDHAGIAEVAAVGVPSALMEEEVFAFVVARAGAALTLAELACFARDALPRSMVPRYLHVVDDLPRTATNKAARQALRKQAAALVADGLAPAETDPQRPGGPHP